MANEQTTKVTRSLVIGGLTIGGVVQTVSADTVTTFQKTVPAATTNAEIDVTVDVSAVLGMAIEADNDCTLKTNSTSSPVDTIALKAKQPLIWATGDPSTLQFFSADVTKFYITTGVNATLIKFGVAYDTTPVI